MKQRIGDYFAQRYLERATFPLSADDISYAYQSGFIYGRTSIWHRVGLENPPLKSNTQIVIVLMLDKYNFDLDVIKQSDYDAYVNNKNVIGLPVLWTTIDALLFSKCKIIAAPYNSMEEK